LNLCVLVITTVLQYRNKNLSQNSIVNNVTKNKEGRRKEIIVLEGTVIQTTTTVKGE